MLKPKRTKRGGDVKTDRRGRNCRLQVGDVGLRTRRERQGDGGHVLQRKTHGSNQGTQSGGKDRGEENPGRA